MMLANSGSHGGPPVHSSAPDAMEASSASPTNATSTDVGTNFNPQDLATFLAFKQQALFAQQLAQQKQNEDLDHQSGVNAPEEACRRLGGTPDTTTPSRAIPPAPLSIPLISVSVPSPEVASSLLPEPPTAMSSSLVMPPVTVVPPLSPLPFLPTLLAPRPGPSAATAPALLSRSPFTEAAANIAPSPLLNLNEAAALLQLGQIIQAQQAAAIAAQQRSAAVALQQAHQNVAAHPQQQERKRSYPCTFQWCVICQKDVHSSKLPCHIRQCHVAKPMFQCPSCDFTSTYSKNNVKSHMVSLHGLAGEPISYMDKYAAQVEEYMKMCFPNVRGRGRPMHGRTSPGSPNSSNASGRRTSQTVNRRTSAAPSVATSDASQIAAVSAALAAQRPVDFLQMNGPFSLNAFSMFGGAGSAVGSATKNPASAMQSASATPANNNSLTNNNNNSMQATTVKQESAAKSDGLEMSTDVMETSVVSSSEMSSVEDLLCSVQRASSGSRQTSPRGTTGPTVKPGQNLQPRYLRHKVDCTILNHEQISNTVYEKIGAGAANMVSKIDLTLFDASSDVQPQILSEAHRSVIAAVRAELNRPTAEVVDAIENLTGALSAEDLRRIIAVAPSSVDCGRFATILDRNQINLGPDEDFIVQLGAVNHLEEKLHLLLYIATAADKADKCIEAVSTLHLAAEQLRTSQDWQSLLSLAVAMGNVVAGDFNADAIKGIVTSQLIQFCSHSLPSGHNLLAVMAKTVNENLPETKNVLDLLPAMEAASEVNFSSLLVDVEVLETDQLRADREVDTLRADKFQLIHALMASLRVRSNGVRNQCNLIEDELRSLFEFMGEPLPHSAEIFRPEQFFARIAEFLRALGQAILINN